MNELRRYRPSGKSICRKLMFWALAIVAFALSTNSFAQDQYGTAAEAIAMLERAVAAVNADKAKALAAFNAGTDGFKDRDLVPFCFNISDGIITASPPSVRGKDARTLRDSTGKVFGEEVLCVPKT